MKAHADDALVPMPLVRLAAIRSMLLHAGHANDHRLNDVIWAAWRQGYRSTVGLYEAARHYLEFGEPE